MDTNQDYSPHQLLPAPEPRTVSPPLGYFYNNVAKHLIKDSVRLMNNGLHIDLDKVEELEKVLDEQLKTVEVELVNNPLISTFQKLQHKKHTKDYISDRKSKMRSSDYYLKPFDHKNMVHRSYFMDLYAAQYNLPIPEEKLSGSSIGKWPNKLVKAYAKTRPILQRLLNGELTTHLLIDEAMNLLASDKANIYNEKYLQQIKNPEIPLPKFNPASSKQKQELFAWLGIEAEKFSKETGLPSFDRSEVERINKETLDPDVKHFTQCFIDHSFAAIVRNNFIEAFYRYTVDDRLYGQYKLFGAKSFRFTSSNPNMLNFPSTKSAFSKPIKKCFTAPKGKLVAAVDYSALENRVIANLAKEQTLIEMYENDLDGHCVNALYYFREEIAEEIKLTGDLSTDAKNFKQAIDNGNTILEAIRQRGKGPTFGLQYGAYPAKIAATIKCTLEEAQQIFDRYHNELYPAVTKFREEYVIPTAQQNNRVHMGLGCYLYSDDPERDIRTLVNSLSQFWSILTLLTINKMHRLIDKAGLQNDIQITSTIYDAIYAEITDDVQIIKWYNDNLIATMKQPYLETEIVHNLCDLEIGYDWASLKLIPNDASFEEIQNIRQSLDG